MTVLYDTSYLRIFYDGFAHTLETEWRRRPTSEELRMGLQNGVAFAREYRVRAWLSNQRALLAITPEDFDWVKTEWFNQFVQLNITHIAVVESRSKFIREGVVELLQRARQTFPLIPGYFSSRDAARAWILSGQLMPTQPFYLPALKPNKGNGMWSGK